MTVPMLRSLSRIGGRKGQRRVAGEPVSALQGLIGGDRARKALVARPGAPCRGLPAADKPRFMGEAADPIALFEQWFDEARASEPNDPEVMALATTTPNGQPSVRMVLLKEHGPQGFTFYTHYRSRKGGEIAANPNVALLFHWKSLGRQVRIEGSARSVEPEVADAYFASRPRDAQIGAWASDQSQPLPDQETFEKRFAEMKLKFTGIAVPRPLDWSGFCVTPEVMEFWTAREHRLHKRRLFRRSAEGWVEGLLYP
jgi:pyridoxamine 5'-phosphate oxidase